MVNSALGAASRSRQFGLVFRNLAGEVFFSLAAIGLVIFFLAPAWVKWQGLGLPETYRSPCLHRAHFTLQQLKDPFLTVDNVTNKVIENRLLFPLIWHYLGLGPTLFLAMPFVGCLLVAMLIGHEIMRRTGDRMLAVLGTALLCTTSWFLTSTYWLTYFDSWYVLGLLVVTVYQPLWSLAVACVLTPWVDERFILALPVALVARSIYFGEGRPFRFLWRDSVWCAVFVAPYFCLRILLVTLLERDSGAAFLTGPLFPHPRVRYLEGAWSGFRALWFVLAAWLIRTWSREGWRCGVLLTVLILGTVLLNFHLAGDLSRGISPLIPFAFLSLLPPSNWSGRKSRVLLGLTLALNLLLPASLVVTAHVEPIHGFLTEWHNWKHPPRVFQPDYYVHKTAYEVQQGQLEGALQSANFGLSLHAQSAELHNARAVVLLKLGRYQEALADVDQALQHDPQLWIARFNRGLVYERSNNLMAAETEYRELLAQAPLDWPERALVENRLQTLRTLRGNRD